MAKAPRTIRQVKATVAKVIPDRYVVTGRPGSGKTTWLELHRKPGWACWDMDEVADRLGLSGRYPRPPNELAILKAERYRFLRRLRGNERPCIVIAAYEYDAIQIAKLLRAEIVHMSEPYLARQKDTRRSAHRRGYDRAWNRFRQHQYTEDITEAGRANVSLCMDCAAEGRAFGGQRLELHHVRKLADDPDSRLDPENVVWLCKRHHSIRTAKGE